MIKVVFVPALETAGQAYRDADGFYFDDGILFITSGDKEVAAHPQNLILSVYKEAPDADA